MGISRSRSFFHPQLSTPNPHVVLCIYIYIYMYECRMIDATRMQSFLEYGVNLLSRPQQSKDFCGLIQASHVMHGIAVSRTLKNGWLLDRVAMCR